MSDLSLVIPAAGASSRMRGLDKLLIEIDGIPLLRRTVLRALAVLPKVVLTLRVDDVARQTLVQDLPVQCLTIADAATGLSASLRGAAASGQGRLMILPADMPDLTSQDLALMISASDALPNRIWRGCAQDGRPGHPVIFPADLRPAFAALSGDQGARPVLQDNRDRIEHVILPQEHALTDLDSPEAWQAWTQTRRP